MNLNLFGHDGHWLMVDCGVTFEEGPGGSEVQMPDTTFISGCKDRLVGLIATHAHQDHIGAIHWLWPTFETPVYTTRFTAEVLNAKLRRERVNVPVVVVKPGERRQFGPFSVEWLPITHSTPETNGLLIETPAGRILHTADWKLDATPVVGDGFQAALWSRLAGVDAIVCDSTNATTEGHSVSEAALATDLAAEIESARGRVVIGCFASNIARLQTLGHVAEQTGRYVGLYGRSLQGMAAAARASGYLRKGFNVISPSHMGYLPRNEVMAIATGSQGEAGSALERMAAGSHPDIDLDEGDRVIFSSRSIPGNEQKIAALCEAFGARGIEVVQAEHSNLLLHASGHPCVEELREMYSVVQPRIAIPVHGEAAHMTASAGLAAEAGVTHQLVGENGDLFQIAPAIGIKRRAAFAGRLTVDARGKLQPATVPKPEA